MMLDLRWLLCVVAVGAQTSGCGSTGWAAGSTTVVEQAFDGASYAHTATLPAGYDAAAPAPLLLYFHGWGSDGAACGRLCGDASAAGYVTAALTGVGAAGWASWNGAGTSGTPGQAGATCAPGTAGYCEQYPSCGDCAGRACGWTTCADSVAQAVAFLDYLEVSRPHPRPTARSPSLA